MKRKLLTRRQFVFSALVGTPAAAVADSIWIEPDWLNVRRIRLTRNPPRHRFVHLTDIHHKGDRAYFEKVVNEINKLAPDFVCFTGDLIEEAKFLVESLELLKKIRAPLYGCPGNHDYWAHVEFDEIAEAFASTGGAWLMDGQAKTKDGNVTINGAATMNPPSIVPDPQTKNIMLIHYPEWVEKLEPHRFDVVLAGHTHGGQVRVPGYGALVLPWGTGKYDLGMFKTEAGPLYVSSGVGWFALNVRFCCRPEIVLFEM
ncbi:MAG: metallophosphoesterase [Verrucomicrobia bacterium]|nr:metallophosphoesterase [Verrucomicrobiota bacterium]